MYMRLIVYTISEGKETVFIGKKKKRKAKTPIYLCFLSINKGCVCRMNTKPLTKWDCRRILTTDILFVYLSVITISLWLHLLLKK